MWDFGLVLGVLSICYTFGGCVVFMRAPAELDHRKRLRQRIVGILVVIGIMLLMMIGIKLDLINLP